MAFLSWLGVFWPGPARALTPASVYVVCAPLSLDERSSLEARLRADLAMEHIFDAELRVRCEAATVVVSYARAGLPAELRSAELSTDAAVRVEQILALSHLLTARTGPHPSPSAAKVDESASAAFPSELPPSATPTPTPAETAPPTPTPLPSPTPRRASSSAFHAPPEAHPDLSAQRAGRPAFEVAVGAASEIWGNELFGTVGPSVALRVRLSRSLRVGLFGEFAWGTARPSGLGVFAYRIGAEARLGHRFWLAVGASATRFEVTAASPLSPVNQSALEPTLSLRLGYSIPLGRHAVSVSAGLRAFPYYYDVRLDGQRQYRLPLLAPSVGAEYGFEF